VQVCEHAVATTAHDSMQWHAVAMRLSASISPPLSLFTCRRNQFLAGIEACCRGSACSCNVPAVANNSERQSEVPQQTHPPFARWASLPLSTIEIDLSKKNCGSSVIVRVQEHYRGRARFFQKLIFYMVCRPKLVLFMQNFKGFPMP